LVVEGIILAAGFSSRAGTFKMALDFKGKSVIENCIEAMYEYCSQVFVVSGYKDYIIEDILKSKYNKLTIVKNPNYENGMFSSIREGVRHITGDKFFLTPGDYPIINKNTYRELLKQQGDIIIPCCNGKRGHPILINSLYKNEIINKREYRTLRDLINEKGFDTMDVNDYGVLNDIDTMEDFQRISSGKLWREG
jgi:molybdenum cofactor cytidylyltransferase